MAWESRFSGIPSLNDSTPPAIGTSTITRPPIPPTILFETADATDHNLGKIALDLGNSQLGNVGYETLADLGVDASRVIRVTARITRYLWQQLATNCQTGLILYASRSDGYLLQIRTIAQGFANTQGDYHGERAVAGVYTRTALAGAWNGATGTANPTIGSGFGSDPGPVLLRIYFNPRSSDFQIVDAGFGSHAVPAESVSYWFSTDDGLSWTHVADLAATAATPTRIGVHFGNETVLSGTLDAEYSAVDVDEEIGTLPIVSEDDPKIYPMIIQSIRDSDRDDGDYLLKRWSEGMDAQWGEIDRKIRSLATLIDPETCPAEAIAYLGWIVGLTKATEGLTGGISEGDYRQLVAIAVRMWKKKGSGLGLVETLRSISGYDVRYLTWFFFRIILGEFELGHAELDVDPWLLDQPGMIPGVAPDAVEVERILLGDLLPSAADPVWSYIDDGIIEVGTFGLSGGRILESQTSAAGGYYFRNDAAELLDPETAEFAARFRIESKTTVGALPWFMQLEDGVRGYRFVWSDGVIALHDVNGDLVVGPRSRGFEVGTEYKLRIVRTGPTTVDVTIDGASAFGEQEIAGFAASANKRYSFGYNLQVSAQDWTISWKDVGPRPILTLDVSTLLGLPEAVPHDVRVVYKTKVGRTTPSYWTGSRNEVSISDALGVALPLDLDASDYRVGVDPDELVSDLRLVDDGTLDRGFVARIVAILRPAGERIVVRFVDFQDDFRNRDLRYWEEIAGTTVTRPDDGRADLEDPLVDTVIHADMPLASLWRQFTIAAQFALRDLDAGKWGEVRFNVQDDENFYAVRINPAVRTVVLDRVLAAARTTLVSHGPLDVFHPDVLYTIHVTTEDVVGGVLIKFYLDGKYLGETIDSNFDEGTMGLAVAAEQRLSVSFADLVVCPFSSVRVGPGLDADPTWTLSCANP